VNFARTTLAGLVLAAGFTLAACGDDDDDEAPATNPPSTELMTTESMTTESMTEDSMMTETTPAP
jgi:hypothetical protein